MSSSTSDLTGRVLLSLACIFVICGPYLADWNETHVKNPRWPPHARFHNGQTMSFGPALGLPALYLLWSAPSSSIDVEKLRLRAASYLAAVYWITQATGPLYPGTKCVDPEFGSGCPQVYLQAVLLSLVGTGYLFARRGVEGRVVGVGGKKRA